MASDALASAAVWAALVPSGPTMPWDFYPIKVSLRGALKSRLSGEGGGSPTFGAPWQGKAGLNPDGAGGQCRADVMLRASHR